MPPTRSDIDAYRGVLNDIGARLGLVKGLLRGPIDIAHQEWAAVELRIVLELIVMGSLVTNREAISKVSSVFKIKGVAEARKIVERVNPEYWPRPMIGSRQPDGTLRGERLVAGEFLRRTDWGREHGFLSDLLQAWSPYDSPRDTEADVAMLQSLCERVEALLRQHLITLAGFQDAYLGQLDLEDGKVVVASLKRPPGEMAPYTAAS
jgi:hypothetical protein